MPPRTSTASAAARRAPSSSAAQIPTYEPPLHTLTPAAQAALQRLKQTHRLNDLEKSIKTASTQLSECAFEINESLTTRESTVKKRKAKAEEKGWEWDGRHEEEVDEFRGKVEKLTDRMEEHVKKMCDAQQGARNLEAALGAALGSATAAGTQSQRRTQMQSFEPTMDGEENLDPPPSEVFTKKVQAEREKYMSLPLSRRYAEHPEYVGFKQSVHEALHGDEVPMPPSSRWFRQEGSPAPGTAAAAAGEEDSDDDLAVQRATISTKCPITLRELEDPVTSNQCPHTFEKSAIIEMIGRRPAVQCPVPGCFKVKTSFLPFCWNNAHHLGSDYHSCRTRSQSSHYTENPPYTTGQTQYQRL